MQAHFLTAKKQARKALGANEFLHFSNSTEPTHASNDLNDKINSQELK